MLVGLVPMGGRAERWAPLVTPKELLPFGQRDDDRPGLVVDQALGAMLLAGVERIVIPITPHKVVDVMRYLGSRLSNGALICYVVAPGPTLTANLAACYELLSGHDVIFAMPDTAFSPLDILRRCHQRLTGGAELALGLFPSSEPEDLDVVDHSEGRALLVRPKPRSSGSPGGDIWGVAAWGPGFSERMRRWPTRSRAPLGAIFQSVISQGAGNCAVELGDSYVDLGCYSRYRAALALHAAGRPPAESTSAYHAARQ